MNKKDGINEHNCLLWQFLFLIRANEMLLLYLEIISVLLRAPLVVFITRANVMWHLCRGLCLSYLFKAVQLASFLTVHIKIATDSGRKMGGHVDVPYMGSKLMCHVIATCFMVETTYPFVLSLSVLHEYCTFHNKLLLSY